MSNRTWSHHTHPAPAWRRLRSGWIFSAWILAHLSLSACTNNSIRNALNQVTHGSNNPLSNLITPGTETGMTLSRVMKNSTNPSSTFDLIGDGSGAFGQSCGNSSSSASGAGSTTLCSCQFTYTLNGATTPIEVDTSYQEANLIRCLYVTVPAAVSQVDVRIHVKSTDSFSSAVTFKFSGTGVTLDPSQASTFAQIRRYQCRQSVYIPITGGGGLYDPFQSEDPDLTFPLNFYTGNLGGALSAYAGGGNISAGWECPSIPNDPTSGMDMRLFSQASSSDPSNPLSQKIYPYSGSGFDRSNFYLARNQTGIFGIPIAAYVAPSSIGFQNVDAQGNQTGPGPMGWAAASIPTGVAGHETCPDSSVPIPTGYQWVKLWQFKIALTPRSYKKSPALSNLGSIQCNPGQYPGGSWVSPDCDSTAKNARAISDLLSGNLPGTQTSSSLVSRLIEGIPNAAGAPSINRCVNLDPDDATSIKQGPGQAIVNWPLATIASGTDQWNTNNTCTTGTFDPAGLCASPGFPNDANPVATPLDPLNSTRSDFLYVVSPTGVMSGDMGTLSSASYKLYAPYRFKKAADCPDGTDPATCDTSQALSSYILKNDDVRNSGAINNASVFPVCALQPIPGSGI